MEKDKSDISAGMAPPEMKTPNAAWCLQAAWSPLSRAVQPLLGDVPGYGVSHT